jgi:hypothetical protein
MDAYVESIFLKSTFQIKILERRSVAYKQAALNAIAYLQKVSSEWLRIETGLEFSTILFRLATVSF